MHIDIIKDKVIDLPLEIYNKEIEIINLTNDINELENSYKLWELIEFQKISDEVDANNKALYSNNDKRLAELNKRIANNDEILLNRNKQKELRDELNKENAKLRLLENEFKSYRYILLSTSNITNL